MFLFLINSFTFPSPTYRHVHCCSSSLIRPPSTLLPFFHIRTTHLKDQSCFPLIVLSASPSFDLRLSSLFLSHILIKINHLNRSLSSFFCYLCSCLTSSCLVTSKTSNDAITSIVAFLLSFLQYRICFCLTSFSWWPVKCQMSRLSLLVMVFQM